MLTMPEPDPAPAPSEGARRPTPEMIAAAWRAFRDDRPGVLLGPGPAFVEAIGAAMAVDAAQRASAKGERHG